MPHDWISSPTRTSAPGAASITAIVSRLTVPNENASPKCPSFSTQRVRTVAPSFRFAIAGTPGTNSVTRVIGSATRRD